MTSTRFADRVVIATGAASGLGLATVRQFAQEGAHLVLVDRAEKPLNDIVAELTAAGGRAVPYVGDVSRAATAHQAVQLAVDTYGRLDVLVNNAGIDPREATSLVDTSEELWDAVIDVNLKSAYMFAKEAIPMMVRTARGGAIVNTASSAGMKASPREAVYGISKAAVIALTRSLARDHTYQGIRANCVCPGFLEAITTDRRANMTDDEKSARRALASQLVPMGREGTYEEVARSILFLASGESSYTSGAALLIDGGWIA